MFSSLEESAREKSASYGGRAGCAITRRRRPSLVDVAAFGDPDIDPGLRAAELFPDQIEESERILPHELR